MDCVKNTGCVLRLFLLTYLKASELGEECALRTTFGTKTREIIYLRSIYHVWFIVNSVIITQDINKITPIILRGDFV